MILSQLEKERWPEREMTQQQMMDAGCQRQQQRQHNNQALHMRGIRNMVVVSGNGR
jgi:hypothetical protein